MAEVRMSAIQKFLNTHLSGHKFARKKHRYWVTHNGKTYRGLPTGAHGASDPEIQAFQVKRLVRFFDLLDTAKKEIEGLK